jgi:hypothetical protein
VEGISHHISDLIRGAVADAVADLCTPSLPRWLPLKRAAAEYGIGEKRLKKLARDGKITGGPDPDDGRGSWIFETASLDAYRRQSVAADHADAVADQIFKKMGG